MFLRSYTHTHTHHKVVWLLHNTMQNLTNQNHNKNNVRTGNRSVRNRKAQFFTSVWICSNQKVFALESVLKVGLS